MLSASGREVRRARRRARVEHEHVAGAPRADLEDPDLVVLRRRAGRGVALEPREAHRGRRRRRRRGGEEGEDRDEGAARQMAGHPRTLPCAAASQAAPRKLTGSATMVCRMSESPDAHRVLVVDDEPNIVDVVAMALRFQGFAVESAGHGRRGARQGRRSFKPQLIVLDVMLPDMEGFDVAKRLGAQRARVPIIYLTARDATEDKIRGLTLGGDDYVTKPFSLEELVARIRSILRRSGLAEPESSRLVFEDLELDEDAHEVTRARRARRADRHRVPAAALLHAQPAPGAHARAAARARLGVRLRRRRARARDLRELPAQEARRPRRAADPHRARRRLRPAETARRDGVPARAAAGRRCSRSPPPAC